MCFAGLPSLSKHGLNALLFHLWRWGGQVHKKILVVDDNELVRYGLEKALTAEGIGVETAATGSEAFLKISSCMYDLCLLDVHLPDFSGMVLIRLIKDIFPNMKVMVMSGSFTDGRSLSAGISEAMQNGACRFIPKPFNLLVLKDIVAQALHTDDGIHAGFGSRRNRFIERRVRKREKNPFPEEVRYSMSVVKNGKACRQLLLAQVINISNHGVGFRTEYPLNSSQIVSFEHDGLRRTGVVAWSTMLDVHICRAGVHFS